MKTPATLDAFAFPKTPITNTKIRAGRSHFRETFGSRLRLSNSDSLRAPPKRAHIWRLTNLSGGACVSWGDSVSPMRVADRTNPSTHPESARISGTSSDPAYLPGQVKSGIIAVWRRQASDTNQALASAVIVGSFPGRRRSSIAAIGP